MADNGVKNFHMWSHSETKIIPWEVVCPSNIGKQNSDEVEVDFANKDIGFGPGGTQEEILFGMTPEACPAVLLCPTLTDHEALVISGVRRVGSWSGYGWEVEYSGAGDFQPRLDVLALNEPIFFNFAS